MLYSLCGFLRFLKQASLYFVFCILVGCGGGSGGDQNISSSSVGISSSSSSSNSSPTEPIYKELHTWWHDNFELNNSAPVENNKVRRSPFYDVQVSTVSSEPTASPSFVYMSIPRSGRSKVGYTYEDGAEFSSSADQSMSWSSFLYEKDVWVTIDFRGERTITSVDEIKIRPTNLDFSKEIIDENTIRILVPYSEAGYRFSVEFDHQLMTSYNDQRGVTGRLSEDPSGAVIHTEPRNALLIFAEPILSEEQQAQWIPDVTDPGVYVPSQGEINLDSVEAEIIYFAPGIYYMPANYHAYLPSNVRWVYLAPGAYVKGALQFRNADKEYKVTGYGVLSGENYVYQADRDTSNGHTAYSARRAEKSDCHSTCVKMLEFSSSNMQQTLTIQGITINEPPYHSFVVYGEEDSFATHITNYKQVGGWYWQTDGVEIYEGGNLSDSFFHANDDVIKIYHSDTSADNIVVWKGENGPVIQFGWASRDIANVQVRNVDVIHNRMYWQDQKHNTCVINSANLYSSTPLEKDKVSLGNTIRDLTFQNIRSEGMNLCAMRFVALSNWEDIHIDGLEIEEWNGLSKASQESYLKVASTSGDNPEPVVISAGNGLLITDYVVQGQPISKTESGYWNEDSLGRLNIAQSLSQSWDATTTLTANCTPQSITFSTLPHFVETNSELEVNANTSSTLIPSFSIFDGNASMNGSTVSFGSEAGGVAIVAEQAGNDIYCSQRAIQGVSAFNSDIGPGRRWIGASWSGWSPGNIPLTWNSASKAYEVVVEIPAGSHAFKITDTDNWSGDDWGGADGNNGVVSETTGGGENVTFSIAVTGSYRIVFDPITFEYEVSLQ